MRIYFNFHLMFFCFVFCFFSGELIAEKDGYSRFLLDAFSLCVSSRRPVGIVASRPVVTLVTNWRTPAAQMGKKKEKKKRKRKKQKNKDIIQHLWEF